MKNERYIIDEREIELLDRYEGIMKQTKDAHRYDSFDKETLAALCRMIILCGVNGDEFSDLPLDFEGAKKLFPEMWRAL